MLNPVRNYYAQTYAQRTGAPPPHPTTMIYPQQMNSLSQIPQLSIPRAPAPSPPPPVKYWPSAYSIHRPPTVVPINRPAANSTTNNINRVIKVEEFNMNRTVLIQRPPVITSIPHEGMTSNYNQIISYPHNYNAYPSTQVPPAKSNKVSGIPSIPRPRPEATTAATAPRPIATPRPPGYVQPEQINKSCIYIYHNIYRYTRYNYNNHNNHNNNESNRK